MIARKSALIMGVNVVNGILGYVAIFLVARFMAMPDYALGIVGFALGIVQIFHIFDNLGFHKAHVKRISGGKDLGTCIGSFAAIKIMLTVFMAVLLVVSVFAWKYVLGQGFQSPTHETAVYVMLVYVVLWSLTQTMLFTFRGQKKIAKARLPFLFETVFRVIATVVVVLMGWGPLALAATYVAGEVALLATALVFFRGYPIKKPSMEYIKMYAMFAFPLAIAVAAGKIMTNVDKVLIQLFWGATEVGNYFAIYRLSRFLLMANVAIGMLLFPTISALYVKNDMDGIKQLAYKAERYLSMVIVPVIFLMVFLARPIIHILLSDKFYPAVPILQLLPVFALFDALNRPYETKLLGMGLPNFARNRVLAMVGINVVLNLLLIPRDIQILGVDLAGLGAMGAAVATVAAYVVGLGYTRYVVWRVSEVTVNYRIVFHFFAGIVMGVCLHFLSGVYPINRWYELLAFGFIGLGMYLGILWLFREFQKEDLDMFLDALNIKKMVKYIKEEIKGGK